MWCHRIFAQLRSQRKTCGVGWWEESAKSPHQRVQQLARIKAAWAATVFVPGWTWQEEKDLQIITTSYRIGLTWNAGQEVRNAMPIPILRWPFDALLLLLYQFVISGDQFFTKKTVGKKVRRDLYTCNGTSTQMKCTYQNEINNQQNKYIIVCIMNLCWGRLMWVCLRIIYFCWVSWKIAFKASRLKTLCASICRRCISRVFLGALFWRGWSSRKRSCRSWRSSSFQWNGPTSVVELLSFEMLFSCEHLWICEPLKVSSFWLLHVAVAYCSIFWRLHRFLVQNSNPGRRPLPLNQRRESAGLWKIPMMCHQMTTCQWMEGGIQVRFHQTPLSTSTTFHRTLVSTLMRFRQILMLTSSQRRNMRKPMGREKVSDP